MFKEDKNITLDFANVFMKRIFFFFLGICRRLDAKGISFMKEKLKILTMIGKYLPLTFLHERLSFPIPILCKVNLFIDFGFKLSFH